MIKYFQSHHSSDETEPENSDSFSKYIGRVLSDSEATDGTTDIGNSDEDQSTDGDGHSMIVSERNVSSEPLDITRTSDDSEQMLSTLLDIRADPWESSDSEEPVLSSSEDACLRSSE